VMKPHSVAATLPGTLNDAHKTILVPYFTNFAPCLTVCCRTLHGRSAFAPGAALHAPFQPLAALHSSPNVGGEKAVIGTCGAPKQGPPRSTPSDRRPSVVSFVHRRARRRTRSRDATR
jgi:hypothetical protein